MLLASGFCAPSAARAGCAGHYVKSRIAAVVASGRPELLDLTGALPTPQGETPRERPTPCSGAFCSGNPATPFPPPPSVPPPVSGQWAHTASLVPLADPGSSAYPAVEARFRPVGRLCSIFHPPRNPFVSL